jgi:hypothetical protein
MQHRKQNNARKRTIGIRHCGCITAIDLNSASSITPLERTCELPIQLETRKASTALVQPVCRQTWTRSYLQNFVPQVHALERPWQDFGCKLLLPSGGPAIPSVQAIHSSVIQSRRQSRRSGIDSRTLPDRFRGATRQSLHPPKTATMSFAWLHPGKPRCNAPRSRTFPERQALRFHLPWPKIWDRRHPRTSHTPCTALRQPWASICRVGRVETQPAPTANWSPLHPSHPE